MDYTTLGKTGLKVSVAGLGCGGASRLGLARGKTKPEAVQIVRHALDLGVNVIDTARAYGTEETVGDALAGVDRDSVVVSTKHEVARDGALLSAETVVAGLEEALCKLRTDHVDVFFLHGLTLDQLGHVRDVIVPALRRERDKGKLRFVGATQSAAKEPRHESMTRALDEDLFDVVMFGFSMFNQNAREMVFPRTRASNVGTMLMAVMRGVFSDDDYIVSLVRKLAEEGSVPRELADSDDPLGFLVHPGGARDIVDAAYRYARHEPGANVVLFGTSEADHVRRNIDSILAPPLPAADHAMVATLFHRLVGVGVEGPGRRSH